MTDKSHESKIWVDTLFGAELRQGLVQLSFGETGVQLRPAEARDLAMNLLRAAEATQSEDLIVQFFEKVEGKRMQPQAIGLILSELRTLRDANDQEQEK